MASLTPSHRNTEEPQPEVCDLCGLNVGGAHLQVADVEGLRGAYICDVTPGCRDFRNRISFKDRQRTSARHQSVIGDSRVFPQGAEPWWEE